MPQTLSEFALISLADMKRRLGLGNTDNSVVSSVNPITATTDVEGSTADLSGYEFAEIAFQFGTSGDTLSPTVSVSGIVQESNNGSTWNDVDSADLLGTEPVVDDDAETNTLYSVIYIGSKRYIRPRFDFDGVHTMGIEIAAIVTRRSSVSTEDDDALIDLINSASFAIENACKTFFVVREDIEEQYTLEDLNSGNYFGGLENPSGSTFNSGFERRRLRLRHSPIVAVSDITDLAGNTIEDGNFTIFPQHGYLQNSTLWPLPFDTNGNIAYWTVKYDAGNFESTAAIMSDEGDYSVAEACAMTVADWRERSNRAVKQKSVGNLSISYGDDASGKQIFAVPEAALAKLSKYMYSGSGAVV